MSLNYLTLSLSAFFYMCTIFGLAWLVQKDLIPARILKSPVIYVLSLGVSIQAWSFYTAVPIASERGYGYLGYYIGVSLAFMFAPVILRPILYITKTHQLSSLADLFSFRFRSPAAGVLITILLTLSMLPFIALQISIVPAVATLLLPEANAPIIAFTFTLVVTLFSLIFGVTKNKGRGQLQAVVVVLAFETIFKLLIIIALFLFCVYFVFGGFQALDQWIAVLPDADNSLKTPFLNRSTNLVVLQFFTAAIAMPHMFHVTFHENHNPGNLKYASWGLPLILLISSLPTFPVLWASMELGSDLPLQFAAIGVSTLSESPLMTLLIFMGGFSAATGILIITALTIANMCLNHLVLPIYKPSTSGNLYQWLLVARRWIIVTVMSICFLLYIAISRLENSWDLGYVTFIACLQCLPGIMALLYWPQGNKKGFIAGLSAGVLAWSILGLIPYFFGLSFSSITYTDDNVIDWVLIGTISLVLNLLVMIMTSLLSSSSEEELHAGELCTLDTIHKPRSLKLSAKNPTEFIERLSTPLGKTTATREVQRALQELSYSNQESRPYPLLQLRNHLEANLSGLVGPTIANSIIDLYLPYQLVSDATQIDINFIESRLDSYPGNLSDIAGDLDKLRRYHRQMLEDMPVGICALDNRGNISLWNSAIEKITGLHQNNVVHKPLSDLPLPWSTLLTDFAENTETNLIHKHSVLHEHTSSWISLHKAHMDHHNNEGQIIVVEDQTETQLLEKELIHSERLASIGSLAAGVAHEIGNPTTAIACLAQNLRDEAEDQETRKVAEKIIDQTRRTSKIVQSLVNFSHKGENPKGEYESSLEAVNVADIMKEAVDLVCLSAKSNQASISSNIRTDCYILADKQLLQQVFVNLLSNALDATPSQGSIIVTETTSEQETALHIEDTGCGIDDASLTHIFEPFYTTKGPGKGTGLGLSLAYSILEGMQGKIRIQSPTDKISNSGTRAIVTFPCYHG